MYFFRKISKKCLHFRICCYIMSSLNELRSVLRTVHINMLSTLFFFINISTGKTTGSARRFSFSRLFSFRLFVLVFSCRSLPGLFICRFPNRFLSVTFAASFLMLLLRLLFSCHLLSPFFSCRFLLRFFLFVDFSLRFSRLQRNTVFGSSFFIIFRQKNNFDKSGNAC